MKSLKSMSKKERKVVLISVSNEVQDLCEFEPAIKTDGKSEKELIAKLTEASEDLRFEDKKSKAGKVLEPADELSKEAISTFEFLGLIKPASEKEEEKEKPEKKVKAKAKMEAAEKEEPEDKDELSVLTEEVENSSKLKELKEIAKDNEEFGALKDQLSGYSSVKSLKSYMLKILSGEIEAPVAKKATAKKTPSTPKGKGVIASIVEAIEKSGAKGISKEKIHQVLVKKFPDRNEDSMRNTINAQVPKRISRERFKVGTTKKGNFFKDE